MWNCLIFDEVLQSQQSRQASGFCKGLLLWNFSSCWKTAFTSLKNIKTTVKIHFICVLCLGRVYAFGKFPLWPLSSTTWWDLAAGCVWVKVCIFTQIPRSPLSKAPPWLNPSSGAYSRFVCLCMCLTIINLLLQQLITLWTTANAHVRTCIQRFASYEDLIVCFIIKPVICDTEPFHRWLLVVHKICLNGCEI